MKVVQKEPSVAQPMSEDTIHDLDIGEGGLGVSDLHLLKNEVQEAVEDVSSALTSLHMKGSEIPGASNMNLNALQGYHNAGSESGSDAGSIPAAPKAWTMTTPASGKQSSYR